MDDQASFFYEIAERMSLDMKYQMRFFLEDAYRNAWVDWMTDQMNEQRWHLGCWTVNTDFNVIVHENFL